MIPIGDYAGARPRFPYVNIALILISIAVFIYELTLGNNLDNFFLTWGAIPKELTTGADSAPLLPNNLPVYVTLVSSIFIHGSWLHLIGNMVFLWVFGDNVEDAMGHVRFLVFYLACGVLAGLTHAFLQPGSPVPLIGASGAVAGVIAAYLVLHPRVRMWVLAFKIIPLRISAVWALGAWIAMQLVMVALTMNRPEPIAWWAHVGGLAAGALLVLVLRRPGVPLFDKGLAKAA